MTMPTFDQLNKAFDQAFARDRGPLTTEQSARMVQDLKDRSIIACRHALGKQKTMRLDKFTTITGTIVKAEFHQVRMRAASAVVQFKIVLECGPAKTQREFICEILPR